jgi:hypothetical protein
MCAPGLRMPQQYHGWRAHRRCVTRITGTDCARASLGLRDAVLVDGTCEIE